MIRDEAKDFKNMSVLREGDSAYEQHKSVSGVIKDYSLKHIVRVEWDLSPDAIRDRICRITIGDNVAIVDSEELRRLLRWV